MKKTLSLLLCLSMLLGLFGCTQGGAAAGDEAGQEAVQAAAGTETVTHEAVARGFGGDVRVTLTKASDETVWQVTVTGEDETPNVGGMAIPVLQEAIQAAQSADVDTVAGATVTSNAVIRAAKQAFDAANGVEAETADVADGVYSGQSNGRNATGVVVDGEVQVLNGVIRTDITFKDNAIVNVEVYISSYKSGDAEPTWTLGPDNVDTNGVGSVAAELLPKAIVEKQTIAVDAICGATVTSNAILLGAAQALESAGAPDSFYAIPEKPVRTSVTKNTDVIVVGAGASGTGAALAAVEEGVDVVWLEMQGFAGGAGMLSGGAMQASALLNREAYEDDSYPDHENYVKTLYDDLTWTSQANFWHEQFAGPMSSVPDDEINEWVSYPMNWYLSYASSDMITWLQEDLGIEMLPPTSGGFSQAMYRSYRPKASYYKDGTEVLGSGGNFIIAPLVEKFTEDYGQRGTLMLNTAATSLIMENGECVGVTAHDAVNNIDYIIYASGGVVLCTGGFESSEEMMKTYSQYGVHTVGIADIAADTGSGHLMAMEAGADYYFSEVFPDAMTIFGGENGKILSSLSRVNAPVVTDHGARFSGLAPTHFQMLDAVRAGLITQTAEGGFFTIVGSGMPGVTEEHYAYMRWGVENGGVYTGNTIAELAANMGIDEDTLTATIENWNAIVDGTAVDEYGVTQETAAGVGRIDTAPYYGFKYGHANNGTFGGVKINLSGQVLSKSKDHAINELTESGDPIPGLYASGEIANCEFYGELYVSGGTSLSIGWVFGRNAAMHAANRAKKVSNGSAIDIDSSLVGMENLQYKAGKRLLVVSGVLPDNGLKIEVRAESGDASKAKVYLCETAGVEFTDQLAFVENMASGTNLAQEEWSAIDSTADRNILRLTIPAAAKNQNHRIRVLWDGTEATAEEFSVWYVNPEGTIRGSAREAVFKDNGERASTSLVYWYKEGKDTFSTTAPQSVDGRELQVKDVGGDVLVSMESVTGTMQARVATITGTIEKNDRGEYVAGVELKAPERVAMGDGTVVEVRDAAGNLIETVTGYTKLQNGSENLFAWSESVSPVTPTGANRGTTELYYLEFLPKLSGKKGDMVNGTYTISVLWSGSELFADVYTVVFDNVALK